MLKSFHLVGKVKERNWWAGPALHIQVECVNESYLHEWPLRHYNPPRWFITPTTRTLYPALSARVSLTFLWKCHCRRPLANSVLTSFRKDEQLGILRLFFCCLFGCCILESHFVNMFPRQGYSPMRGEITSSLCGRGLATPTHSPDPFLPVTWET